MSLFVYVSYEPDGSPSMAINERSFQLKVSRLQCGRDVCKKVYEQAKCELKEDLEEYSLFWPDQKMWILHNQQLGLAKIEAGAKLLFRPNKTCLRIRFLDASSKLINTDATKTVRQVVSDLCHQLRLQHPEELSLVVAGDYAVQKHHPAKKSLTRVGSAGSPIHNRHSTLTRKAESKSTSSVKAQPKESAPPLSPRVRRRKPSLTSGAKKTSLTWSTTRVKKQISKKHQIRLDTPWLDPDKTLAEQEVTENDELILMYRFYYHMELDRDSPNIVMLYKQARATYLAGELLCSAGDMVQLSAILCQITKGNYSKYKYSPEFLSSIKNLIAPPKCKLKGIAKQITATHKSLEGLPAIDAMCWFIKLWSSLDLFGVEFLSCTNLDTKDKGLIGVSKSRIMLLFHKKKKSLIWDIDSLMHWDHDTKKDTVSLTLTHDGQTQVLNLHLQDYSGVLVDCLRGHRELSDAVPDISRTYMSFQFSEELETAISEFAPQVMREVKDQKILSHLTYEKVFWAGKIENPMLSEEELSLLEKESWENPVFDNMDQLMDERFNFLDFSEYTDDNDDSGLGQSEEAPSTVTSLPSDPSSHETSPVHSPTGSDKHLNIPQQVYGKGKSHQSPLLRSQCTNSESFLANSIKFNNKKESKSALGGISRALSSSHSGSLSLTNGLLSKPHGIGHTRSRSSGSSSGDSDSGHNNVMLSSVRKTPQDGGPLSSSSLPPEGMRLLITTAAATGEGSSMKSGQITAVSYQETT